MWEYNRSHRTSKVALRDVGKVIKALVGDFYHPLYLSKEFQAKLMPEKRLEGADICQRLLGSNKLRSSQDYSNMSPSSSSSSTSSSSHHNGAICPRTLGLKDNVRFIDYNEDYDLMNLNSLHLTSPPPPLPPPPPTSTTTVIEEIGFRNPAFLECDKYGTRAIIRRGATSVEPAEKNDGDNDDDDNDYDVDDREDHDDDNEIYGSNMNGFTMNSRLPRSSTTMTTVSGEPLISSNVLRYNDKGNTMGTSTVSHLGSSRIRDGTIQQQYHLNDEGNSSRPHNTDDMSSQLKKSKYLSATRNNDNGNRNGYSSRNKHGRRPSSQTNEHDMLIPGQPLIYNATITNINRSGHSSRGPYTSLGPGHFRITGRAPLAYDATSMGTTTPIQSPKPIINDTLQFSFDNEHVQRNSVLISSIPNEKSNKPVLFEDETINKPSRSCLMSCIQRITSFCSRLFRCNTDTKKVNKGLSLSQESTGIKGPKEFATLRAMAALAAATAATAVADPTKTTQGDEEQTKSIQLDRPARELLIWSILVGKLRMAELFWTMEKEPIAAALLASILLTSLGNKTDDFTDKEDYRSFAKNFQERAEGVLNECYREDEHRTQLIINHELIYYGRSSVIKLAAEGQSIKFMAHPCCQDFLTNTWSGNLSTKNSVFRYIMGVVCGLTLPFLIPKVILSKPKTNPTTEGEESSPTSEQQGSTQSNHTMKYVLTAEDAGKKGVRKTLQARTVEYISQIRDFYMAPVVRFVYNTISYITFLILFSYLLLVDFRINITVVEYIVIAWVITLFIEEIKQIAWAVLSGISFRTYISDGWNKLDCAGLALYIIGFILRLIVLLRLGQENNFNIKYERYYIVTDPILDPSRICLAISLFTFYIRLMYTFSFHIALGPKLIMIGKMVTNDLIPFMIILTVIMVGYAVAAQSIAYPNGLFTKENMTLNSEIKHMTFADIIFSMYTTAYFQMFGDFSLDALQGEDRTCQNHMCPTKTSRWLVPIMLGFYVLLTNILMFNLLIAMFSKTYEEIESASTYYWNYQRYQMINDYVHRSPLAPPIIIVWHFYEAYKAIGNQCASLRNAETAKYNPFCVRFTDVKKEREMVKWEHMKAMDYLREPSTKATGKRGVAESRAVVFRGGGGVGPGQGPVMDLKSEMSSVTEGIGMELEKRFKEIDNQFQRFNDVDSRLNDVTQLLTNLSEVISNVTETQQRIIQQINELPTCQCNEFTDEVVPVQKSTTHQTDSGTAETRKRTKLEVAIQSALEAAKDVLRPPTPPPPPPPPPPPQRESPVLLAAVVPGSEDDSSGSEEGGDPSADPVLVPQVPDIKTGRVIERTLGDHRLWRMAPFNFEKYPGMRMNVPPERMAWTVEYPDYFAYDACEEILLFPSEESHDGVNENLRTINFNQYDAKAKLRRQSLLGRYRLDSTTGAPLNPMGRTGLLGKGLLPRWGPNHSFVLCITRWTRDTRTGAQIIRSNRGVLQYLALERNKRLCMPWYLTDHTSKCDFDECVLKIISSLITRRGHAMLPEKRVDRLLKRIEKAEVTQIFKGYLDDQLNADSAWMETVVINLHESESKGAQLPDDILKLLNEPNTEEQSKWIEVSHSSNLRTSHNYILKNVAELRRAFY
ncbi:unnamed protein product [Schistosoma rodhaini]|nr:unnamed protein product [Schistosoma rodhaini]